jgi:hypothetical protein
MTIDYLNYIHKYTSTSRLQACFEAEGIPPADAPQAVMHYISTLKGALKGNATQIVITALIIKYPCSE